MKLTTDIAGWQAPTVRRVAVLGALVLVASGVLTGPATAGPVRCSFDTATAVLRIDLIGDTNVTLRRGPHDGILVNGNTCGATMFNTDRVRVVGDAGDQTVYLDLGGGRFGPGKTPEQGIGEVEVSFEAGHGIDDLDVWGTEHADEFHASLATVVVNHDGDAGDVFGWGIDRVRVYGMGGHDILKVNGYRGYVFADGGDGDDILRGYHFAEHLSGGFGSDRISAGDGNDRIDTGGDSDAVRAGDGNDRIKALDANIEKVILCGPGDDTVLTWDAGDQGVASGCENWVT